MRPKVPELTKARNEARRAYQTARNEAYASREAWERKENDLKAAAKLCRVSG